MLLFRDYLMNLNNLDGFTCVEQHTYSGTVCQHLKIKFNVKNIKNVLKITSQQDATQLGATQIDVFR